MELDLLAQKPLLAQIRKSAGGRWVLGFGTQNPERLGLLEFCLCAAWEDFGPVFIELLMDTVLMISWRGPIANNITVE